MCVEQEQLGAAASPALAPDAAVRLQGRTHSAGSLSTDAFQLYTESVPPLAEDMTRARGKALPEKGFQGVVAIVSVVDSRGVVIAAVAMKGIDNLDKGFLNPHDVFRAKMEDEVSLVLNL